MPDHQTSNCLKCLKIPAQHVHGHHQSEGTLSVALIIVYSVPARHFPIDCWNICFGVRVPPDAFPLSIRVSLLSYDMMGGYKIDGASNFAG